MTPKKVFTLHSYSYLLFVLYRRAVFGNLSMDRHNVGSPRKDLCIVNAHLNKNVKAETDKVTKGYPYPAKMKMNLQKRNNLKALGHGK